MGNVLGFALLEGNLIAFNNELFGNIVPGSIITTLVYGAIASLVWQRRNVHQSKESERTATVQSLQ
jgi:F0F1-type ATP synthase membrane subunit a